MLSKDKLINIVLLLSPAHGHNDVYLPEKTYIHQLWIDHWYHLEDLSNVMTDRDGDKR